MSIGLQENLNDTCEVLSSGSEDKKVRINFLPEVNKLSTKLNRINQAKPVAIKQLNTRLIKGNLR